MSWRDRECYLCPLQSLIVSLLLSFVSTILFFSDWRRIVLFKFFDTQVPSAPSSRSLCPSRLPNKHSLLLNSYLTRISRIENYSCSTCEHLSQDTSHLILHCPATDSLCCSLFSNSLSLYLWSRPWGVAQLLVFDGFWP